MTTPSQALAAFPLQRTDTPGGTIAWRSAGDGVQVSHVLLHGIGSSSSNWVRQLQAATRTPGARVLAWEAPGYGQSTPLLPEAPSAAAYAERLWRWLDALGVHHPVTLVGHSLGSLMAGAAAHLQPARVSRLILLSPARGYGAASAEEREAKLRPRLDNLQRLGPAGVAAARSAAMLSPGAPADQVDFMRESMAQIIPAGYTQAARMLAHGDLCAELETVRCPVAVASGSLDTITTPAACQTVAAAAGVPWQDVGPVGHACPLQAHAAVNALLGLTTLEEEALS